MKKKSWLKYDEIVISCLSLTYLFNRQLFPDQETLTRLKRWTPENSCVLRYVVEFRKVRHRIQEFLLTGDPRNAKLCFDPDLQTLPGTETTFLEQTPYSPLFEFYRISCSSWEERQSLIPLQSSGLQYNKPQVFRDWHLWLCKCFIRLVSLIRKQLKSELGTKKVLSWTLIKSKLRWKVSSLQILKFYNGNFEMCFCFGV